MTEQNQPTHPPRSETCSLCGGAATHKVGEEYGSRDGMLGHNYTNYLCCPHFAAVMGPVVARDCGVEPATKTNATTPTQECERCGHLYGAGAACLECDCICSASEGLREQIEAVLDTFGGAIAHNRLASEDEVATRVAVDAIAGLIEEARTDTRRWAMTVDELVNALGPAGEDIYRDVLAEVESRLNPDHAASTEEREG